MASTYSRPSASHTSAPSPRTIDTKSSLAGRANGWRNAGTAMPPLFRASFRPGQDARIGRFGRSEAGAEVEGSLVDLAAGESECVGHFRRGVLHRGTAAERG